jgi:hypothetical protein
MPCLDHASLITAIGVDRNHFVTIALMQRLNTPAAHQDTSLDSIVGPISYNRTSQTYPYLLTSFLRS